MSADLKHLNGKRESMAPGVQFNTQLTQTIRRLFAYTLITVLVGSVIALMQNWSVRVSEAHNQLIRSASMANFLVETNLAIAEKSLKTTRSAFEEALASGPVDAQLAGRLLEKNYEKFKTFNNVDMFGLVFFVDNNGMLVAQSGLPTNEKINFSDRYYYYQLRDHTEMSRAIGPLVFARTTKKWLFHLSIPLRDKNGKFVGALVQQLSEDAIALHLAQYTDTQNFEQLMTHVTGSDASFVYPPPDRPDSPSKDLQLALTHRPTNEGLTNGGAFIWDGHNEGRSDHVLIQVVKSPLYDLETYATYPSSKVMHEFWLGNLVFLIYVFFGMSLSTALFVYLHYLSKKLASAQEASLYDALTKIHNRRALDEILPILISDSMRTQEPISVLFIDIDHFRYFNTHFGHENADTALKAVAQTLVTCVNRPLDFVCRWGGEEFVIVLPKTNNHAAMKIAYQILNAVRGIQLESKDGEQPSITVSIGYATDIIKSAKMPEDLVKQADDAMRQAKSQGRDQCVAYMANTSKP